MTLFGVEWAHPWAAVVAVVAIPVWWWIRGAGGRVVFSSMRLLPARGESWRTRLAWLPAAFGAVAVVALALALAGPRVGERDARIRKDGIAIVMVVDTSSSMAALDLSEGATERTRLDAVQDVFEAFVLGQGALGGRPDDAIGLVSFARYADTRSPLTLDHGNLVVAARALELAPPRSREDGTAVGDGLALAVERLAASPIASKVAILLTDGEDNASAVTPEEAALFARDAGVRVYTIGAGTVGTAPVRMTDPRTGRSELVPVPVSIDERLLEEIAQTTGGAYFRATDAAGLRAIYAEIDRLERTEIEETRFVEYREYFDRLVVVGLGLALVGWLLGATVLRRLP